MQHDGANMTQSILLPAPRDCLDMQSSLVIDPLAGPLFDAPGFYQPFTFESHVPATQDKQQELAQSGTNDLSERSNPFDFGNFTSDEMQSVLEAIGLFDGEASHKVERASDNGGLDAMPIGNYSTTLMAATDHPSEAERADCHVPVHMIVGQPSDLLQM